MALKQYTIDGEKMWLDKDLPGISDELVRKGKRELCFMEILRDECAADVGLDVGANIGYTTIPIARRCKKVYAFEPDKRSRKLLRKNAPSNVVVEKSAVSDANGSRKFSMSKKPNQSGFGTKGKGVLVETITLDAYFRRIKTPESLFLKCDIEGHEIQMIKGFQKHLRTIPHVKLLMELHCKNYDDIFGWLRANGFDMKYIVNAKGMMGRFSDLGVQCVKMFEGYNRAIWWGDQELDKICSKKIDGKKMVRSVLWVK